ncbi:MAG: trigger factor [Eubacterium sp.]|nr:trigger factor [Eubacterium sp.]MBR1773397.1 trigger factor [Eubacterium sp.]
MKFRKISALLVVVMMISLFSGCGNKSKGVIEDMAKEYSKYVTLGEYKGVSYVPTQTPVTEDSIQYDIQNLISQNTKENKVMTGIATEGDTVNIDYVGSIDGEEFDGGSTQGAGTDLELGSGTYIEGFEEQIMGHSPGDAFDVEVTFPDDYGSADLAGKDAVFKTVLNYIVEKEEPKYDDALVASATDYTTVEEYEKSLLDEYKKNAEESDLASDKNSLFQQVIDNSTVSEYPQEEVEERIKMVMDNVEQEAEANGVDVNTYLSNYGYTLEDFKSNIKDSVQTYIKEKMVVVTIAEKEKITVTDEEADAKVQELLEMSGLTDKETLNQQYGFTDEDYYYEVLYTKIMDFIYDNAVKASATDASMDDATTEE